MCSIVLSQGANDQCVCAMLFEANKWQCFPVLLCFSHYFLNVQLLCEIYVQTDFVVLKKQERTNGTMVMSISSYNLVYPMIHSLRKICSGFAWITQTYIFHTVDYCIIWQLPILVGLLRDPYFQCLHYYCTNTLCNRLWENLLLSSPRKTTDI